MLNPSAVVLGDEEVLSPRQDVAIQTTSGDACHVDIAIGIGSNRIAQGVGLRHTELLGIVLRRVLEELDHEDPARGHPGQHRQRGRRLRGHADPDPDPAQVLAGR